MKKLPGRLDFIASRVRLGTHLPQPRCGASSQGWIQDELHIGLVGRSLNTAYMRHKPIDSRLFSTHRHQLQALLVPKSLAIVNANDVPPTNADGTMAMVANSDLFYLAGIAQ